MVISNLERYIEHEQCYRQVIYDTPDDPISYSSSLASPQVDPFRVLPQSHIQYWSREHTFSSAFHLVYYYSTCPLKYSSIHSGDDDDSVPDVQGVVIGYKQLDSVLVPLPPVSFHSH
jgi:hypothetical protein